MLHILFLHSLILVNKYPLLSLQIGQRDLLYLLSPWLLSLHRSHRLCIFLVLPLFLLLNVMKHLAGIDHSVKLIPQDMIEPIQRMKTSFLHGNNPRLHTDEVLVTLAVLSQHDEHCRRALDTLPMLDGCQVHVTTMLSEVDRKIFKKLGCDVTFDPIKKK